MVYKRYDHRNLNLTKQKPQRIINPPKRDNETIELPSLNNNRQQIRRRSQNLSARGRKNSRAIDSVADGKLTVNNRFEFNEDRRAGDGESLSEYEDEDGEPMVTDIDNVVLFLQNKATKRRKMRIGEQLEDIKERMEKALSTYEEFGDTIKQSSKTSLKSQGGTDVIDSDDEETQAIPIRRSINRLLETYTTVCREREDVLHTLHDSLFSEDVPEPDHDQQGTSINLLEMDKIATDISFTLQNVQIKSRQLQELNKRLLALSRKGKGVANLEQEKIQLERDLNLQQKVVDQFKKFKIARAKKKERGDTWKHAANEIVDLLKTVRKEGSGHLELLEREFQNLLEAFQAQSENIDSLKADQKIRKQAFVILEKEKYALQNDNILTQDQLDLSNKENKQKINVIKKLTDDLRISEEENKLLVSENTAITAANNSQNDKNPESQSPEINQLTKKFNLLEKKNKDLESEVRALKENKLHNNSTKQQAILQNQDPKPKSQIKETSKSDGSRSSDLNPQNQNQESYSCVACSSSNQRLKELRQELFFQRNRADDLNSDVVQLREKLETAYEEIAHLRATAETQEHQSSTRLNTPDKSSSNDNQNLSRNNDIAMRTEASQVRIEAVPDRENVVKNSSIKNVQLENTFSNSNPLLKDNHTLTESKTFNDEATQASFDILIHGKEDTKQRSAVTENHKEMMAVVDATSEVHDGYLNERINTLLKSVTGFVKASGKLIAKSKGLRADEETAFVKPTMSEKEDVPTQRSKTESLERSPSALVMDEKQTRHAHGRFRGDRNKIDPEIAKGFRKIDVENSQSNEKREVHIISVAANHAVSREKPDETQPRLAEENRHTKSLGIHRPSMIMRRGSTREFSAVHLPVASVECPTASNFELTHTPSNIKNNERLSFSQHDNAFHYRKQTLSNDPIRQLLHKDLVHHHEESLESSWKGTFNILRLLSMSNFNGCSVLNQEVTSILNNTNLSESEKIKRQLDVVTHHATQILQIVASSVNMLTAEGGTSPEFAENPTQFQKLEASKLELKVPMPTAALSEQRNIEVRDKDIIEDPPKPESPPSDNIQIIEKPKTKYPREVAKKPKDISQVDNQAIPQRRLTKPMPQSRNRMMEKHKRLVDRLINSGATMKDVNTILGLGSKRSKENIEIPQKGYPTINSNFNTRRTSRVSRHGTAITPIGFPMVTSTFNPNLRSTNNNNNNSTAPQRSMPSFTSQPQRPKMNGPKRKERGVMSMRSEQPMTRLLESSLSSKSITQLVERKSSKQNTSIKRKLSRSNQRNKTMFPPLAKDLFTATSASK